MINLLPYKNIFPKIGHNSFVAPNAFIIGDVSIGEEVGVWFNVTIRGDVEPIVIGNRTNIQDGSVIHVTRGGGKTFIGSEVTIGHMCMIHAAKLQDRCFIGMSSTILDGAIIEENSYVAAGSLVTGNKTVKSGELWAGRPAKFFRKLTDAEITHIKTSADNYVKHVYEYTKNLDR